jgi:signal transduction histidine kinase
LFLNGTAFSQIGGLAYIRDSLKNELRSAKHDTTRVLIMSNLTNAYFGFSTDTMSQYGNKALELAQRIHFSKGEASALTSLGLTFQVQGDFPKSLEYLYRSLEISEEKKFVFESAVCYSAIANAYWFLADYPKTEVFAKKSQELFKTITNNQLVNLWMLFNELNMGYAFVEYNLDSAYFYLKRLETTTRTKKYTYWRPGALNCLGFCLFRQGDRETSFKYLREGITGAYANGDYLSVAEGCATIADFFKTTNHPDSIIYYADLGMKAAQSIGYGLSLLKNSKLLAEGYEYFDTRQALYYRKMYDSLNESLYGAKKVLHLQQTLAEEQYRQQQIQKKQLELENRIKQYGFMAGLAAMFLIIFLLFRNNLQRKKANELLLQQKEKVEVTLLELKSTQSQLIQSEKMASLGELTAGIAHEIQNPLNFVNNFSEVNAELINELESAAITGNLDEVKAITKDIKENEARITHHGKRADAIVKGMLQHSRTSSGQKEPTDINALCDEYLRLAYHGLRAKDNSFNAKFETHLDPSLPKLNVIPQDMGRVLLNLINNAFYAVNERVKSETSKVKGELSHVSPLTSPYEPLVTISTKNLGNKMQIMVKDNGSGIPDSIKEKIFQPFFTTKPTGQGTGLGLSLSYDIVKAQGGEIKVKTVENEGTEFTILLSV